MYQYIKRNLNRHPDASLEHSLNNYPNLWYSTINFRCTGIHGDWCPLRNKIFSVGALRTKITDLSFLSLTELVDPELGSGDVARLVCSSPAFSDSVTQALVSFKKYMSPPLPVCAGFFICIRNSLDRPCVTMP